VLGHALESGEVGLAVPVIAEDDLPVEPSHPHMGEGLRRIEAGLARHGKAEDIAK